MVLAVAALSVGFHLYLIFSGLLPNLVTRPLHLMWCAVNRTSHTGSVLGIEQALTAREALRAHTIDAAWQVFLDHERGSIEPGKRADFAVLSANPLDDPAGMHRISVEETIVKGTSVFAREKAAL